MTDLHDWDIGGNRFDIMDDHPVFVQEEPIGINISDG